jgi:DNA-binding PadR family transcriptional regulator
MSNVINFETNTGQQKGILTIYLLYSLQKKPKSGYEIISEIKEKTEETWIPSKGTIYPLLRQLEKEGLITIKTTEKRSKKIFKITPKGKKMILSTKKQGESMMKKFMKYRNLIIDMIEEDREVLSTMMQIQNSVSMPYKGKKNEVIKILKHCASDLQKEVN